jgi:hypothetical protein
MTSNIVPSSLNVCTVPFFTVYYPPFLLPIPLINVKDAVMIQTVIGCGFHLKVVKVGKEIINQCYSGNILNGILEL